MDLLMVNAVLSTKLYAIVAKISRCTKGMPLQLSMIKFLCICMCWFSDIIPQGKSGRMIPC